MPDIENDRTRVGDNNDSSDRERENVDAERECILISSTGKSGSKRLLRILDLSRVTHCRNEPYNLSHSPFRKLHSRPGMWVVDCSDNDLFAEHWNKALRWSSIRNGDTDFLPPPFKTHLRKSAQYTGLLRIIASRRGRKVLGTIFSDLRRDEWVLPSWIAAARRVERARLVVKINLAPGLSSWVLSHRPRCQVVHLIRHPAAVLRSWQIRHLAKCDPDEVRSANIERLRYVTERCPSWATRFGDLVDLSAEEAELWYWCYVHENLGEAGQVGRYLRIRDEDIALKNVCVAKRLYSACELPWDSVIERALKKASSNWRGSTSPWQALLRPRESEMVARILSQTWLGELWEENQIVSRIDYQWKTLA